MSVPEVIEHSKAATVVAAIEALPLYLITLLQALDEYLNRLGRDVDCYDQGICRNYRRRHRFAAIVPRQNHLTLYLLVNPALAAELLTADSLAEIGHYNKQKELILRLESMGDLERAKPAIARAYAAKAPIS